MFNWGIREGRLEKSPFKLGTETVIKLQMETPRVFRFANQDDEDRVLALAASSSRPWPVGERK